MSSVLLSKTYKYIPFCEKEILRYAGCKCFDDDTISLLNSCIEEVKESFTYKVCYRELTVKISGDICDFDILTLKSSQLASNLKGCNSVILFAATVGVGVDRMISKYGKISPSKALMFQAIGAGCIEALCDTFCEDIRKEYRAEIKPRFSPGYGDLSLSCQKDIFAVLDCERKIGLTLNESLMMSPSKSVTAIVGIGGEGKQITNKCSVCDLQGCNFRGAL